MKPFTVNMQVSNWPCLVIGGGEIALPKAQRLVDAGAKVTLICKKLSGSLESAEIILKDATIDDIKPIYKIAIFGTDNKELNRMFYLKAQELGIVSMAVDDMNHADFFMPALVQRGKLELAISSQGSSPSFSVWLKRKLNKDIDESYGKALDWFAQYRTDHLQQLPWKKRIEISQKLMALPFLEYFRKDLMIQWNELVKKTLNKVENEKTT